MKQIVSKYFYQKKNWESVETLREIQEENARMTPEEKAADEREAKAQWERIYAKYEEIEANTRYVRNPLATWIFHWATNAAVLVAEHFEMNVIIESSDDTGHIRFTTDQVISEKMWMDQKYRNRLLRMMRWADGVWIDTKKENEQVLVQLCLTYKFAIRINLKK